MNTGSFTVADVIRQRRVELGMSLAELAQAVGVRNPEFLLAIEKGHRCVGLDNAQLYADALRLDAKDLMVAVLFELYPGGYKVLFGSEAPRWPRPAAG